MANLKWQARGRKQFVADAWVGHEHRLYKIERDDNTPLGTYYGVSYRTGSGTHRNLGGSNVLDRAKDMAEQSYRKSADKSMDQVCSFLGI